MQVPLCRKELPFCCVNNLMQGDKLLSNYPPKVVKYIMNSLFLGTYSSSTDSTPTARLQEALAYSKSQTIYGGVGFEE